MKLPKKAASSIEKRVVPPTFRFPSADTMLQAADKQRKYLRRGSKTPKMLLISAGLDLSLFENGILPTEVEEKTDGGSSASRNIVAIATQKALAMAAAVDFLSEAKLEELRTKERSVRPRKEKFHDEAVVSLVSGNDDKGNRDQPKMQLKAQSFHPRRLSAMTALKINLEKVSISTTNVARRQNK